MGLEFRSFSRVGTLDITLNFRIQIFKMRKTKRSISQILEFFSIQTQQKNQSIKNLESEKGHTDRKCY